MPGTDPAEAFVEAAGVAAELCVVDPEHPRVPRAALKESARKREEERARIMPFASRFRAVTPAL
jgi:hypothetical protein